MIYKTVTIEAQIADSIVAVSPEISGDITVGAELSTVVRSANYEEYTGSYSVTPSSVPQTLATAARVLLEDIVVEAIPSNYGLITWNGSTLTVS